MANAAPTQTQTTQKQSAPKQSQPAQSAREGMEPEFDAASGGSSGEDEVSDASNGDVRMEMGSKSESDSDNSDDDSDDSLEPAVKPSVFREQIKMVREPSGHD